VHHALARFPNTDRLAPKAISEFIPRKYRALDRRHYTGTSQPQAPDTLHQKLACTLTRRAACTITSVVRCRQPTVWSNSSSGIGSAPKSAGCFNGPWVASTSRFAVWTDPSRMLLCKRELRHARRRDGNFIRRTLNRGEVGTFGLPARYDFARYFVLWETNRQKASPNSFKFAIRPQWLRW